jgi:hypothetical protein
MSRRVQIVYPEESEDDEYEESWWKGTRKRKRRKENGVKEALGPSFLPPLEPLTVPEVYFGEPTEEEIIENVRNLPDRRPGGKVRIRDSWENGLTKGNIVAE